MQLNTEAMLNLTINKHNENSFGEDFMATLKSQNSFKWLLPLEPQSEELPMTKITCSVF